MAFTSYNLLTAIQHTHSSSRLNMQPTLWIASAACAAIIAIGSRFILSPRVAMTGFGVSPDSPKAQRALTEIKGIRDITSGVVPIVVWAVAGPQALGWVLTAAALTPIGDMMIVLSNGGKTSEALGIHGFTAVLLVATGLTLALG